MGKFGVQVFKCPVPECDHICGVLTNVHCNEKHNMDRDEVIKLYGDEIPLKTNPHKIKKTISTKYNF